MLERLAVADCLFEEQTDKRLRAIALHNQIQTVSQLNLGSQSGGGRAKNINHKYLLPIWVQFWTQSGGFS